jgi:transcription elongation factor S-II
VDLEGTLPPKRAAVLKRLRDVLSGHGETLPMTRKEPYHLASEVENALYFHFTSDEKEYINKARSVLFNLGNAKNPDFRSSLLMGFISASEVPRLTAEEMAGYDKQAQRQKMRRECMDAVRSDWEEKDMATSNTVSMLPCEECGSTDTTWFELQMRSGDEPMTTFAKCRNCGHKWKSD